ncbi:MAG: AarF/ABC1/UbiB kinase family protein [Bacillota bacterium]|nr:AarF/ABC1/UbiB kinase family protein [Bacillota bacterium]
MRYYLKKTHVGYLPRYREVANILIKHGFGFIFENTNHRYIPWRKRKTDDDKMSVFTRPQRLRMALEELGPAYIKLGQLMSIRPDILGPDYIKELEKLQNNVPAIPFEQVQDVCEKNSICLAEDFAWVNPVPIAAASIAQVHEGQLKNGRKVVIKVQRPGVDRLVESDLAILAGLAALLEKRTSWGRFYRVSEIVEELSEAIFKELDFNLEGRNADIFLDNFKRNKDLLVPQIYWEYCTKKVLTMEYLEGIKISDFAALRKANMDLAGIADKLVKVLFEQIYVHGFFHADPHPGNIAINRSGQLIFYDFGQVGLMDDALTEKCMNLMISMMRYDVNGVTRALLSIGIADLPVNKEALRRDVSGLEQKYYGLQMSQIKLGEALAELLELSSRYQVRIPSELSLLVKMLMTVESIVAQLDPQLSIVDIAEPYGRRIMMKRYSPSNIKHEITDIAFDYYRLFRTVPREIDEMLNLLSSGELKIKMEHENMVRMTAKFDVMSNRLALAIIVASIIIGTALMADKMNGSLIEKIPMVDLGFALAMILGLFLAYSILKSGKY